MEVIESTYRALIFWRLVRGILGRRSAASGAEIRAPRPQEYDIRAEPTVFTNRGILIRIICFSFPFTFKRARFRKSKQRRLGS